MKQTIQSIYWLAGFIEGRRQLMKKTLTEFCDRAGCGYKNHSWKDCEYAEICAIDAAHEAIKMKQKELVRSDAELTCFPVSDFHIGQVDRENKLQNYVKEFKGGLLHGFWDTI